LTDGQLSNQEVKIMPNNKKKYLINPGFSQSTKKGFAHAGAIVTADLLTIENAEEYLEKQTDAGKFTLVKSENNEVRKENTDPITTDSQRDLIEKEPELPKKKKQSGFGAKKR
jgi:hypothetical protein